MKHRIIIVIVGLLLFASISILKIIGFPEQVTWCRSSFLCEEFWRRGVFWPISESVYYLILALVLLIPFPYHFLKTWMKIMIPYTIVALIIISLTPPLCGGMICFDRTLVASGLSKLFLISTIIILLAKGLYLLISSKKKSN